MVGSHVHGSSWRHFRYESSSPTTAYVISQGPTLPPCILTIQYGYHISVLNQIQAVLTCRVPDNSEAPKPYLPVCIPMTDATFSVLTSVYTIGGLIGSAFANVIMDSVGRKGAVEASSIAYVIGASAMSVAGSLWLLIIGR